MLNFCTYFDSNYMSRGLVMYESLLEHCPDFHLYIVTFDDTAYQVLNQLKLSKASIISLKAFEDIDLLNIKESRTYVEYMWTCTPSVILYCIQEYALDHCTYLDADLYFFGNPEILIKEAEGSSILLTQHNYTLSYDKSSLSGIYCVQFMMFRNDALGLKALQWWRQACLDWCFNRYEQGKFGDQKYLDDWTERFKGVHVIQHKGGGVAPWNVQQYETVEGNQLKDSLGVFSTVFYHFHYFRFLSEEKVDFGTYAIKKDVIRQFYSPYIKHLQKTAEHIQICNPTLLPHGKYAHIKWYKKITRFIRSGFKYNYNIYTIKDLL